MTTNVQAVPKGYHTLTPYLNIKGAANAIEFYEKAFGAKVVGKIFMPDGYTIAHAEIEIGDSKIMLAEENEQWRNLSPSTIGDSAVSLCLYVEDVDAVFARALKEGAKAIGEMEVKDQFYGDRAGSLADPFGHKWSIMTHKEDVSFDELQKRMNAMMSVHS
jgi:PhnB protein